MASWTMTAAPPKAPRERPPAPRVMFASGDGRRSSNKSVDIVDMEELDLDLDFPCKLAPNCAEEEEKEGVNIRPAFFSGSDESPSFDYVGGPVGVGPSVRSPCSSLGVARAFDEEPRGARPIEIGGGRPNSAAPGGRSLSEASCSCPTYCGTCADCPSAGHV